MTTLILSAAGRVVGASLASKIGIAKIGGAVGSILGSTLGNFLDNKLLGTKESIVNYSTLYGVAEYGSIIPIVYGRMKVEGRIIWAAKISMDNNKMMKGNTAKELYATFAVALCEGEITNIHTIWADTIKISPDQIQYVLYPGNQTQMPDPTIISIEKQAPAYRGLAYVVITGLPLNQFGNRIPHMAFEVERRLISDNDTCNKISAVNILPSSGESTYDTIKQSKVAGKFLGTGWIQSGHRHYINNNSNLDMPDSIVALNQLQQDLPNVKWLALTISWFADSLDIGECSIYPAVEFNDNSYTYPDDWMVNSISRKNARLVSRDNFDRPVFGGTPSDSSVIRYVNTMKERGYKIMCYPLLMIDVINKPWRGRMTGTTTDVTNFFAKYNPYILHYATLLGSMIDGIIIGSEMIGLTAINDGASYPAIYAFIDLARQVRNIIGQDKIITYAANWNEYHSNNGNYPLDELWANNNIDVVGIDAYFPLTDIPTPINGFTKQQIMDGWTAGEGWDYYYDSSGNKIAYNSPTYAWKNISNWWNTLHTNADGSNTQWQPQMKKIWFTEFGFPSIDCCTNQPYKFYDPKSIEGGLPKYSVGQIDNNLQKLAIDATIDKWHHSDMVTNMFLWAWDARPYPHFPNLNKVWADGALWPYGHWVNGKINNCSLSSMLADIASRASMDVDTSDINDMSDGYIIAYQQNVMDAIALVQLSYGLNSFFRNGTIVFKPRNHRIHPVKVAIENIIPQKKGIAYFIKEICGQEYAKNIKVNFITRSGEYAIDSITVSNTNNSQNIYEISLPAVMNRAQAEVYAYNLIRTLWINRQSFQITLPMQYLALEPFDSLLFNNVNLLVQSVIIGNHITIEATSDEAYSYNQPTNSELDGQETELVTTKLRPTEFAVIEVPAIYESSVLLLFPQIDYTNWPGANLYVSYDLGNTINEITNVTRSSTYGTLAEQLAPAPNCLIDKINTLTVYLCNGELHSTSEMALFNGDNLAIIGNEIIQFQNAELIGDHQYKISNFIRGKYNTSTNNHHTMEVFYLIDENITKIPCPPSNIGRTIQLQLVTTGMPLSSTIPHNYLIQGTFFKPFAPTNLIVKQSTANLVISWVRCTRINNEWKDRADVPLEEELEKYEVDILIDGNFITTVPVTNSTTLTYALQDHAIQTGTIEVIVHQISNMFGRGYEARATISL